MGGGGGRQPSSHKPLPAGGLHPPTAGSLRALLCSAGGRDSSPSPGPAPVLITWVCGLFGSKRATHMHVHLSYSSCR